jgi:hypothetical protein
MEKHQTQQIVTTIMKSKNKANHQPIMSRNDRRAYSKTSLLVVIVLLICSAASVVQAGINGSKLAPPNSNPRGKSMAEWLKDYVAWYVPGQPGPAVIDHVLFPAVPLAATGSGTEADPLILTGHGDFTIEAGTAFITPLLFNYLEIYDDGSRDPISPDAWFGTYVTLAEGPFLDGQQVITEEDINGYYVRPQFYDPPIPYSQPTSYGSFATYATQGWMVFCNPLPVGVHEFSWSVSIKIPDNDVWGFPIYQDLSLSYTITVVP